GDYRGRRRLLRREGHPRDSPDCSPHRGQEDEPPLKRGRVGRPGHARRLGEQPRRREDREAHLDPRLRELGGERYLPIEGEPDEEARHFRNRFEGGDRGEGNQGGEGEGEGDSSRGRQGNRGVPAISGDDYEEGGQGPGRVLLGLERSEGDWGVKLPRLQVFFQE